MAKVLVIRLSAFGDVAMLVPVLASVAKHYCNDSFTVLTRPGFASLFQNLAPNIDTIAIDPNGTHKGFGGLLKLASELGKLGFTHVIDEHDVLRTKIIRKILRLKGHKVAVIDKGRKEKKAMIASKATHPPLKSTIQRYRDAFDKLGFAADISFSTLPSCVNADLPPLSWTTAKTGKWIGIAPFAKHKGKIYPTEKMEKVLEALSQDSENTILLFGAGAAEKEVLSQWSQRWQGVHNMAGTLKLEQELALIAQLDVMLTMDSANMHLASLVDTPVVSIWGATHPALGFYGFGQKLENAVQIDLECRPCSVFGDKPCARHDYACMLQLDEMQVVNKIYEVLKQK